MRKLIYIIPFLLPVFSKAQTSSLWQSATKEEIVASYKKICDWFINTNSYSFNINYSSFKNHTSNEVIESSEGYYKRAGLKYVSNAVGIKTIQDEKARVIVDTSDKIIAITNPGNLSPEIQKPEELVKLLENVKALKKKINGKNITYRIDFRKNELYDTYEFTVNEKGLLEKMVYYYAEQVEKDYGDGEDEKPMEFKVKPRLEIGFSKYAIPAKTVDSEFTDKSIVLASKKVELLDKYKSYQVKDYRTPLKK